MLTIHTINSVKDKIRIEEIIGDVVTLKRKGVNLLGCCPFHNEKTGSFTVSPLKGIYKCFGCGVSGDAIAFLMEYEGSEYVEVIRKLAERYNVPVEETAGGDDYLEKNRQEDGMYILNTVAAKFFQSNKGDYFEKRGLTPETIAKFMCGFSGKGYTDLIIHLKDQGYTEDNIVEVGLAARNDRGAIDLFRNRAMFPIHNLTGKIIGFGGRDLTGDKNLSKYVNTPETPIYSKGKVLYGLYFSKQAIRMKKEAILVEGYTDVATLNQYGVDNTVASSGTALSVDQVRLIKRHTLNMTVLFDGDKAGIDAAIKSLEVLLMENMNVLVLILPDNHDPDSFIKAQGIEKFLEWKKNHSMSVVEFICSLDIHRNEKFTMLNTLIGKMDGVLRWIAGKEAAELLEIPEHLFAQRVASLAVMDINDHSYKIVMQKLDSALKLYEGLLDKALKDIPDADGENGLTIGEMIKSAVDYVGGKFITTPAIIGEMNVNMYDGLLNHGILRDYQIIVLDYLIMKAIMSDGPKAIGNVHRILEKKQRLLNPTNHEL